MSCFTTPAEALAIYRAVMMPTTFILKARKPQHDATKPIMPTG
jgi:hypothetical protein